MNDRFDFEQQIIKCWGVCDDIKEVSEHLLDYHESNFTKDRVSNTLIGLAELYEIKFHKLWEGFEDVVMGQVKHIKMLEEECAAMREQLREPGEYENKTPRMSVNLSESDYVKNVKLAAQAGEELE